ncbi:TatD family hydrolase, partial [Curtobacterium sp. MMLR14_014]
EIGLDSRARVDRRLQLEVFEEIAAVTVDQPRFVSVHSSGATSLVLDVLEEHDAPGRVLHWWRGSRAETDRALELGCYFSVNVANELDLSNVPLERLLTETDHPSG